MKQDIKCGVMADVSRPKAIFRCRRQSDHHRDHTTDGVGRWHGTVAWDGGMGQWRGTVAWDSGVGWWRGTARSSQLTTEIITRRPKTIMPGDDDDTIITDLADSTPKKLTHAKQDQLAAARIKALESRRKAQKAGLEARLHEVKSLLGELDPKHIENVQQVLMSQERDLRRQQKELTRQFIELVQSESTRRMEEHASVKRAIERTKQEIETLLHAHSRCAKSTSQSSKDAPSSAVSHASSKHSIVPLSNASSVSLRRR